MAAETRFSPLRTLRGLAGIGIKNVFHALLYGLRRDALDSSYRLRISASLRPPYDAAREPGALRDVRHTASGAVFIFDRMELSVGFLLPNLVFTSWKGAERSPALGAEMSPSWAVARTEWPGCALSRERIDNGWRIDGGALVLEITDGGALRLFGGTRRLLREEDPPARRGKSWTQTARIPAGAGIYGLGSRFSPLDKRRSAEGIGGSVEYRFWNKDPGRAFGPGTDPLYLCMPVYLAAGDSGCHLVFHDNTHDGTLRLDGGIEAAFCDGTLRTYFAAGSPAEIMEAFTDLTGRSPIPPLWALGFHQSRWGYGTEAEIRRVFSGFKEWDLPLSAIHLDIDHLRGHRTLTIDEATHPDLAGFARELAAEGVHLVVSTDPGIKKDGKFGLYADGVKEDVFCRLPNGEVFAGVVWAGLSVFPDFTSPRARSWWGRQYARQLAYGVDGFWHDMNEPASFAAWGDLTFPLCVRHDMEGRGGDHREAHNIYGMMMNRAGYEGLRALRPDRRPFILSRSGWVGMQKWSWTWTGDVETSWQSLRTTVGCVLGLGLCGMPYTGPDIGGFMGVPSRELFVRWFQLSSFLPFFRTHCAVYLPPREPWCFGEEALACVRESLKTRYMMLPYWYTLSYLASRTGAPLVRPLFWEEPESEDMRIVDDSFLLGGDLLVAPVLEKGARKRTVVLPRGRWWDLAGQCCHEGPAAVSVDAPLSRIPVLARAGSMIPMRGENGDLVLHAFAASEVNPPTGPENAHPVGAVQRPALGMLYSDAGDGYGASRVDTFSLRLLAAGEYELECTTEGAYPWPYASLTLRLHGFASARVEGRSPSGAPIRVEMA